MPLPKFQRNCAPPLPSVAGLKFSAPLTTLGPLPMPGSPMTAWPRRVATSASPSTRLNTRTSASVPLKKSALPWIWPSHWNLADRPFTPVRPVELVLAPSMYMACAPEPASRVSTT